MRSEKNDDEDYANAESYESFESHIFKYLNHLSAAVKNSVRKLWCMNIFEKDLVYTQRYWYLE